MASLPRIARRQAGVFTRQQALQCGVPLRDITERELSGEWVTVVGRVLASATTPLTPAAQAWAGVLDIGQPVAVAGRFAAVLLGLDGAPSFAGPQFLIPDNRHWRGDASVQVARIRRADWAVSWHRGLPFVPLPLLLRQLAAELPQPMVRDMVQHALRRRRITEPQLLAQLGRGRPGAAPMRGILEELAPGYQSMWERRVHRGLLKRGVRLKPQTEVVAPDGRRAFLDLGDEEMRFGVEIDGFLNHMARFAADRKRARMLGIELEWTIPAYAVDELVTDFDAAMDEIVRLYERLRLRLRAA